VVVVGFVMLRDSSLQVSIPWHTIVSKVIPFNAVKLGLIVRKRVGNKTTPELRLSRSDKTGAQRITVALNFRDVTPKMGDSLSCIHSFDFPTVSVLGDVWLQCHMDYSKASKGDLFKGLWGPWMSWGES
jgi:hypothetical protein